MSDVSDHERTRRLRDEMDAWLAHRRRLIDKQRRPGTLEELAERRGRMNPRLDRDWLRYLVTVGATRDEDGWRWKLDPTMRMGGFGPWRPEWSMLRLPGIGVPVMGVLGLELEVMGWGTRPEHVRPYLPAGARFEALEGRRPLRPHRAAAAWSPTWCWSSSRERRRTRDHLAPTPPDRPGAAPPDRRRRPRRASAAAAARAGRAHARSRARRCRLARPGVRARLHRTRPLHRAGRRGLHLGDPRRRRRCRARAPRAGDDPGSRAGRLRRAADRRRTAGPGRRRGARRRPRTRRGRRAPRLAVGALSGARARCRCPIRSRCWSWR